MSSSCLKLLIPLTWFLLLTLNSAECDEEPEPPFPNLIDSDTIGQYKIHLVSESVSDDMGYETTEEFADFNKGKSAFIVTSRSGHHISYVDSMADLIYHYKPYTCIAMKPSEMEMSGYEGLLHAEVIIKDDIEKNFRLYGITALWHNAGKATKTYTKANMVYSASKDVYKTAHKWSFTDKERGLMVHFFFIESQFGDPSLIHGHQYALEMIQMESIEKKKIITTINILSVDTYIAREVYDNLLEVPVGYGCVNEEVTQKMLVEIPSLNHLYFGPLLEQSHKIVIEATATKFELTLGGTSRRASSDTVSLELVRTIERDLFGSGVIQLVRQRDSNQDLKTILYHQYNTMYEINMRTGSCKIKSINSLDAVSKHIDDSEKATIRFANQLSLEMDHETMHTIFADTDSFYFIKRIQNGNLDEIYFERSTSIQGKSCRIIRVFTEDQSTLDTFLDRVSIWVFDEKSPSIVAESYHMNIVDAQEVLDGYELARLLDVSEECYLNNANMKPGKDFAWIQLNYPTNARVAEMLPAWTLQLKEMVFDHFMFSGRLSIMRSPRIEIILEDSGFVLRVLLLDLPPLHVMFESEKDFDLMGKVTEDIVRDIEHCSDLCRLSRCKAMSFYQHTHLCKLSVIMPTTNEKDPVHLVNMPGNEAYVLPKHLDQQNMIFELSLHKLISEIQHQDFGSLVLPKVPDELLYPTSETGIDKETHTQMSLDYLASLHEFLQKEAHRMPMLTLTLNLNDQLIVLLPDRFELEDDPLGEFRLDGRDTMSSLDDQLDKVPPFHKGMSMSRFRTNGAILNPNNKMRQFTGLNYDQCALACIDSRCSSFSYCEYRQECVLTDIYDFRNHLSDVEMDSECFIAQRDFLSKFNKFDNVLRSTIYKQQVEAVNPSECAHTCIMSNDFNCLAFDYCKPTENDNRDLVSKLDDPKQGSCIMLDQRVLYTGSESPTDNVNQGPRQTQATGCDHYSRSYLADFNRIEYREIEDSSLATMKSSSLEGKSVDQCAETCVTELIDCTAFQFCFDPYASDKPMQSCIMIESSSDNLKKPEESRIVLNQTDSDQVIIEGSMFKKSANCHLFSLRKDSTEAYLRDLAINSMSSEEYEASQSSEVETSGLSIGGGIILYLSMTLLFAALSCGVLLAKNHNEYVRQRIERIRIIVGI